MRIVGRGHPSIRATHDKTLELSADDTITERATCVVAIDAIADPLRPLAGPIRVTISAGTESFEFGARANPGWDPAGGAVIRRSPVRTSGTFATHASASSADLPRRLVAELTDPQASVTIEIEPADSPPCAVLALLDPAAPPDRRLAAEIAAADLLVVEDDTAGRLLGERVTRDTVPVEARVLVVSCDDLPGRSVTGALTRVEVETLGMTPALAAAAASPSRGHIVFVAPGADPRSTLRGASTGSRVVVASSSDRVAALIAQTAELRGVSGAVVTYADRPPVRVRPGESLPGRDPVQVCFDLAEDAGPDPAVRAAVNTLLEDGVPTKAIARVLAALTGWDRRRAYDAVLAWRR